MTPSANPDAIRRAHPTRLVRHAVHMGVRARCDGRHHCTLFSTGLGPDDQSRMTRSREVVGVGPRGVIVTPRSGLYSRKRGRSGKSGGRIPLVVERFLVDARFVASRVNHALPFFHSLRVVCPLAPNGSTSARSPRLFRLVGRPRGGLGVCPACGQPLADPKSRPPE